MDLEFDIRISNLELNQTINNNYAGKFDNAPVEFTIELQNNAIRFD